MIKKCSGCGLPLQYTNENELGYAPKKDAKICQRCFKLKNYNQREIIDLKYNNDEIIEIINKNAESAFFITDFINLSNEVINIFNKITKNKYLVINKCDLIPNSINKDKYISWVKETYNIDSKILLISASRKYNINELNNKLDLSKNNYICGFTNSGKSTIINELCLLNKKSGNILSSLMPNTTLDVIKIKLDEGKYVYDTPGFISNDNFDEVTYPKSYLKPVTIQTKPGDVISVNNNIFIKCDENTNSFTFYMSDKLNIRKVYDTDINFNKSYDIDENNELFISSYGFINIKNKCSIKLNNIDNYTEVRKSMF